MTQRRKQSAVREGRFNTAIHNLRHEFAESTMKALAEYDVAYVEATRRMVEYLALPWYKRLFIRKPPIESLRAFLHRREAPITIRRMEDDEFEDAMEEAIDDSDDTPSQIQVVRE